jgi:uncharacterized protein YegL
MQSRSRTICGRWLLSLALAALCSGCAREQPASQSKTVEPTAQATAFEQIPVQFLPLDVVLIVDQSGSMVQTTDPSGLRVKAAEFFIEYLRSWASIRQDHRLGVVNFGSTAPPDKSIPLQPVGSASDNIKQAIEQIHQQVTSQHLGHTMFVSALREAKRLLDEANAFTPDRQPALIILTDGEPDDGVRPKKPLEYFFREIENYISENLPRGKVPIYVVAIDQHNQYWPSNRPYWERLCKRAVRIESAEREALIPVYMQVIGDLLGFEWQEVTAQQVQLPPYLERVSFTLLKLDPAVRLRILDPNGKEVSPQSPGVLHQTGEGGREYEIYSITDPQPGSWTVEPVTPGGQRFLGQVKIYQHSLFVTTIVHSPRALHPQGKPMSFKLEFRRRDEKPVEEISGYPLRIWAKVLTPSARERGRAPQQVDLKRQGSVYVGEQDIATTEPGVYAVDLWAQADGHRIYNKHLNVEVKPLPYLKVGDPEVPWHSSGEISARLMQAGQPVSASSAFHPSASAKALVMIRIRRDGQVLLVDFMHPVEEAATGFHYRLPPVSSFGEDLRRMVSDFVRFRWGDIFRLTRRRVTDLVEMKIVGQLPDGSNYESEIVEIPYERVEEWWSIAVLFTLPIVTLIAIVAFVLRQSGWWLRAPKMALTVYAEPTDGGERTECSLYGRKRVKVGLVTGNHLRLEKAGGLVGWIMGRKVVDLEAQDVEEGAAMKVIPVLFSNPSGKPVGRLKRLWAWFFLPLLPIGLDQKMLEPGRTVQLEVTLRLTKTEEKQEAEQEQKTTYDIWVGEGGN